MTTLVGGIDNASSGGGAPSGPAGGDLGGTYPNPTVVSVADVTTGILAPANGGVANITTADQGYLCTAAALAGFTNVTAANIPVVAAGTEVRVYQIVVPFRIVIGHVTISVQAAGGAGTTVTVGLYTANGNTKVVDSGTFNGNSATTQTNSITPVTVNPGPYFYAQSASTQTTLTCAGYSGVGSTVLIGQLNNQTVKKWGTATNTATAGVLPSTLGTISAATNVFPIWTTFEV